MSSQKDKFLASAQKFIQKGQFDRALRDYEQVVTADPKDVKHRQKLAELMVRCNRKEDAVHEYETIAKYYDENRFYLKSIAVYKQIQRLDPSNTDISLSLAMLNEKQGMIGNALTEYKVVFENYEKNGQLPEAMAVLGKMQSLDPDNVDIRLKMAESQFSSGAADKAYQAFTQVALLLKNRGNIELFDKVCRRIQELFPNNTEAIIDIIEEQIKNGVVTDVVPKLQQILEGDPDNTRILRLMVEAHRISGDLENVRLYLEHILRLSPDDLSAKKGLIESYLDSGAHEDCYCLIEKYLPDLFKAGAYGEIERYYTTLQNQAPYDIRLLEGLKKLYEITGESGKFRDVQVSLNILSQKTETGQMETPPDDQPVSPSPHSTMTEGEDTMTAFPWETDIDLSSAPDIDAGSRPEPMDTGSVNFEAKDLSTETVSEPGSTPTEFDIDISFDFSDEADIFAPSKPEPAEDASFVAEEPPAVVEQLQQVEAAPAVSDVSYEQKAPEADEELIELDIPDEKNAFASINTESCDDQPVPVTTTTAADTGDRLEDVIPSSPVAPDEMEQPDIHAQAAPLVSEVTGGADDHQTLLELDPFIEIELDIEEPLSKETAVAEDQIDVAPIPVEQEEIIEELSAPTEEQVLSLSDEVQEISAESNEAPYAAANHEIESAPVRGDAATEAIADDSPHLPDDLQPPSHDFFADLSDDDFTLPPPELETGDMTDKYTFDGMFSRFKESLDQQVEEGDTETHYNLGIAYMEMGLFDDAIKEFSTAGKDPGRRTDCHTLQAVCCREKGDFDEAERLFMSEIAGNGLDADRILSLHYELGLLYEASGRKDDALASYREVFGVNPGFRDTMKKIARLSGKNTSFDLSQINDVDIDLEEIR